jgi:hypothetical protein
MLSGLLVTQMFPATMLLLPLYLILIKLHLLNSYLGVIVIYTATALPFCCKSDHPQVSKSSMRTAAPPTDNFLYAWFRHRECHRVSRKTFA